jgi:hypothetical protein
LISKEHPPIAISGNIIGIVHDEFGNEISNFTSKLVNKTYHSYKTGYYHFAVSNVNKNGVPVNISKDDYQYNFTLKPLNNEINYFSHTIFTKPKSIVIQSDQPLSFSFDNNAKIVIEPNAYMTGNEKFMGEVTLKSFVPDLQNPIHLEAMPGDHLAEDHQSNEVWLDYNKAIYFEIKTINNNELTTAKKSAHVSLKSNNECEKCMVWRYDDTLNLWKEHFTPVDHNNITFEITQSGFYCLATPEIYNLVEGILHSENIPYRNQAVDIYDDSRLLQRVYTTNNGKWFTHLPINRKYEYKFIYNCSDIHEESFSIAEEDQNQVLPPNIGKQSSRKIKGEIRNCKNELVNEHFLQMWQEDKYRCLFFKDAKVDIDIFSCSNEKIFIQSANEFWNEIGPKLEYTEVNKEVDFLRSYSCNEIKNNGYFNIKLDDKEKLFFLTEAKLINNRTKMIIYDLDPNMEMIIIFSGKEPRNYNDNELNIYFEGLKIDGENYEIKCENSTEGCGFKSFNIETYGDKKGSWIKGNFKGDFWVKSFDPLMARYRKIEAEFLVPRSFN